MHLGLSEWSDSGEQVVLSGLRPYRKNIIFENENEYISYMNIIDKS